MSAIKPTKETHIYKALAFIFVIVMCVISDWRLNLRVEVVAVRAAFVLSLILGAIVSYKEASGVCDHILVFVTVSIFTFLVLALATAVTIFILG